MRLILGLKHLPRKISPLCRVQDMVFVLQLGTATMVAKMMGWLTTYRTYKFLASLHFYKKTLSETAHLAYTMQKQNALITDNRDSLQQCLEKLDELEQEDIDLQFDSARDEDGKSIILPMAINLPATQQFKQTNQLSEEQKNAQKNASPYIVKNLKSAMSIKENKLSIELKKPSCFL